MITVKDVWRGAMPDGTELLGGGGGLDRRVEWATALRTRPPAFETIKGGEMAFVPVRSIRLLDERLDLAQVIQSFGDKGGVAVAVVAADPPVHEFALPRTGMARLVAPVPVRDGIGGFISLIAPDADLDQISRLAVARAASACAIELDRERAVLQARDELEGEF